MTVKEVKDVLYVCGLTQQQKLFCFNDRQKLASQVLPLPHRTDVSVSERGTVGSESELSIKKHTIHVLIDNSNLQLKESLPYYHTWLLVVLKHL